MRSYQRLQYFLAVMFLVVLFSPVQAETYYFHNDQLGTPQVVTDVNQEVVWKGEYDPFGKVTETVAMVEQNIRFPGQYFDVETGLHYNYFRDYDPTLGRYIQSDPIGQLGGINTYGYTKQNPLIGIDPFGLDTLVLYSFGIPSNPFGHVAFATTGRGIHSIGTTHGRGTTIADYINSQAAERNLLAVVIPTTSEQEEAMTNIFNERFLLPYSELGNSCATVTADALSSAGISDPIFGPNSILNLLPSHVYDIAAIQENTTHYYVRQGQTLLPNNILDSFNRN